MTQKGKSKTKSIKLNKRQFMGVMAGAPAGMAAILKSGTAPALAAKGELTYLGRNWFIKEFDAELKKQGAAFARKTGIKTRIDTIHHKEKRVKVAAEAQAKAGHDIILLRGAEAHLYQNDLVDVSDLAAEIAKEHGDWFGFGKQANIVNGRWLGIPWGAWAFVQVYRPDYFKAAGATPPKDWRDIPAMGEKLKKSGHPIGFAISQTNDSFDTLYAILWSFGGSTVDKNKIVTINSPQTAEAIELVKECYFKGMTEEVLAWGDGSNNQFMHSGKGSWTLNPLSIYIVAQRKFPELAEKFEHLPGLTGPAGRHEYGVVYGLGIWKFSKHIEAAKDFIRFHFENANFRAGMQAAGGYNLSPLPAFTDHKVFREDPKKMATLDSPKYMHIDGWPAEADRHATEVSHRYVVPIMFAKAVTGTPVMQAMEDAERDIKKIYAG